MSKQLSFIIYGIMLISLSYGQQLSSESLNVCTCSQLMSEKDCGMQSVCQWNAQTKICQNYQQLPEKETYYCDQFEKSSTLCANAFPCAWNGQTCGYFTSCTAYVYDTDEKCQTISKRCFSNGVHCNEYGECYTYNTQNSCLKNSNNKFCYWNNENINNPKCELADQCSKLPKSLNSDAQCREQLNECTVSANGGCVISGVNCQDQVSELSCFSNKDRTQNCFWNEGKCMDKICDNASKLFITDKACSDFLKTCTTKQGGGCVTRSNCSVAIQAACIKDINENDCFWNGQGCFNKTCSNALKQYNSNLLCQQYLKTCITTGSGCVENTGCEAAIISDACEKTIDGQICHWDGKACKLKTCENAGSNYVGHDQCTQYMSSCTAKLPNGCQNRQCDNAPVSNNTNDLCKSYLINGNCITKLNGGCKINTNCESIDIDIACVQDINGQQCFWNDGKCLTKICSNSPTTNNTHQLCQDFLSSCTVGPNNNCVEKTCENIQQVENCISDFNSKPCNIKTKCYKKYCSLASKNITTHQECQQYLSNCTLDNSGYGCMDIPKLCQGISNIKGCIINADNKGCAWSENKCVDRQCNFADQTFTTTDACNTYKTGCVVNNNLKGCIQLPIKCSGRKQKDNCEIEAQPKCQWDNVSNIENPICIDIKCENAHLVSLKDVVSINGCWNYYSLNCGMTIINETKVCIPRPTICNGLIQLTCQKVDILVGDQSCYWDDIAKLCKPQQCASITFQISNSITHSDCNNNINKCTVNQDQSGCVDLKECNLYTTQKQCVIDQNKKECFWDGQKCNYSPCSSADDSDSFKTQIQCDGFSNQCTLNQTKCSLKKTNCSEYKNQGACETNTLNKQIQCVWEDNSCKTSEGDFDCTQIKGEGLTYGYCSSINFYCSVNAAGTSCIESKNCSDYEQENCSRDYIGRQCIYFAGSNYCDVDCLFAPGPFTDDYCFEYSETCTITVDGSKCVNYLDYCDGTALENCTYSLYDQQCLIKNGQCVSAENNALVYATCESYKQPYLGLNYCMGISKNFNSCSVNSLNNSCVKMEVHCSTYNSKEKCYFSIQDGDCFWSEVQTQCLLFTAQKCSEYTGTSVQECKSKDQSCTWITGQTTCSQNCSSAAGPFDLDICLDYGFACNVKLDAAGCVDQVDTCANTNKSNCQLSQEGFCYLKEDVCTLASSDYLANDKCETITGVNLTAYYCLNISQNNCSANSLQNKCVRSEEECYQYQVENCHESYNYVKCVISEDGTECMDFQYLPCSKIKIYGLTIYTNYHCQQFRASCQSRQDQTGCEDKIICSDKKGSNLSYMTCLDYSVKCSVNSEQTQCVNAKKTCSEYSVTECGYSLNEGECMVSNNLCIQKSCDLYDSSIKNMSDCQSLSQNCVIRVGGCYDGQCSSYTIQQQCTTDYQNKNCLWNPTAKKCVDSTCQAAENTTFFDTHLECQKAGDCTVKANNKTLSFGCIPLVACNLYVIKEQCVVDNNNVKCIWNDIDELNQSCGYKSCSTAPLGINTSIVWIITENDQNIEIIQLRKSYFISIYNYINIWKTIFLFQFKNNKLSLNNLYKKFRSLFFFRKQLQNNYHITLCIVF